MQFGSRDHAPFFDSVCASALSTDILRAVWNTRMAFGPERRADSIQVEFSADGATCRKDPSYTGVQLDKGPLNTRRLPHTYASAHVPARSSYPRSF